MKRLAYTKLIAWKNKEIRKPLVIRGARQVGKTWLIKEFGRTEFDSFAYVNCDANAIAAQLFEPDFDMRRILRGLSAAAGVNIEPGKTLIFIDEIQEAPKAMASLKYFAENAPEYHVIAAGSLLGIHEHQDVSFPVGKIESLELYPMSFFEFVLAQEGKPLYEMLANDRLDLLSPLHTKLTELLREYYFTGGMPEAVSAFVSGASPQEVRTIQKQILSDYRDDISKHAPPSQVPRIDQVWSSIPSQLSREKRKFAYANIKKGARAKEFEIAIQWLCDAGLVTKVNRVAKGQLPLKFYEDFSAFKLFLLDCGLMGALCEAPASQILIGDHAFTEYKGAFTEQYVLEQLKTVLGASVFYLSADDSTQELDFIFQNEERIVPVEVQGRENLRAKAMRIFCAQHPGTLGVRLSMSPYRVQDWMGNLPLYAAERILETFRQPTSAAGSP